ncbi:hypothetical protein EG327_010845 [Venturia inaequalis]|uniref:chitin synthase n=1 Tax=Venturia inaequalis TaxID=5025 RepID=A0A8H3ZH52_VENIN|nr:hypothetical protein EG327_010845 [Venturia inaequalis]
MSSTAQDDLSALPEHLQSDTGLGTHLAARFHAHLPTARLSSHATIAINNYASSARGPNGDETGSAMASMKDVASRLWARLGYRNENQAVIFLGESGAGKTTLRSHLLSNLMDLTGTPLSNRLSNAAFIFDSFTTTKTATTHTASKAGLFYELQYEHSSSTNPTLIGGKLLDHRLERQRISTVPIGERNFHVLYYLMAGTSEKEKAHLGLDNPGFLSDHKRSSGGKRWRYLGNPKMLNIGIDDKAGFTDFRKALQKVQFSNHEIGEICQVLAAVLHMGQLEFHTTLGTTPAADDSGGYSHEGGENITRVSNRDTLGVIAAFLGVSANDLEQCLGYKTKKLHNERVTVMLDPEGARQNADEMARTLYSLLVAWVVESMNSRISVPEETIGNTISIVDFPGFAVQPSSNDVLDQLLNNAATEALYHVCLQNFFERQVDMLDTEEVVIPATSYFDNSDAVKGLLKSGNGVLAILDGETRKGKTDHQFLETLKRRFENKNPSIVVGSTTTVMPGSNFATRNASASFSIKHFAGEVDYPIEGLLEANAEVISGDVMNMMGSTQNDFMRELFGQEALSKVHHPKEPTAVLQAAVASKPMRMPSMAKKKYDRMARLTAERSARDADTMSDDGKSSIFGGRTGKDLGAQAGIASQFLSALQNVTKALAAPNTNSHYIFCLKSNDRRIANSFDSKCIRQQIQTFGIVEISQRLRNADFSVFMPFDDFNTSAEGDAIFIGSPKEKAENILDERGWRGNEAQAGATGVFLSERCWLDIASVRTRAVPAGGKRFLRTENDSGDHLTPGTPGFSDSRVRLLNSQTPSPGGFYSDDKTGSYFGGRDVDAKSDAGVSAINGGDMFRNFETREHMAEKGNEAKLETVEEHPVSGSRKRWMFFVWLLTFYIPTPLIRVGGGWKGGRKDVKTAWREKLAINILIWLSCAFVIFFMIGFPELICPKQDVFSPAELTSYNNKGKSGAYVSIRGVVYDLKAFSGRHYPNIIPAKSLLKYSGLDATTLFPVQVSALCAGKDGSIDPAVQLDYSSTNYTGTTTSTSTLDVNARYHDFRWFTNDSRPDWWFEQQYMLKHNYLKGRVGYTPTYVHTLGTTKQKSIGIIHSKIYDMTSYIVGGRTPQYPAGSNRSDQAQPDSNFMDDSVVNLFQTLSGSDLSKLWDSLTLDAGMKDRMLTCLNNLFYVGDVDTRNSTQCLFAKYLLLSITILLVSVIGFKFLAALQFGKKTVPENLDKFVMCVIPAYTEDEDSLRRAMDSIARMRYDDKRKLMVVICDGMIVGQGNDRPTPRIVLDILGVPESMNPEALSFESLGEGMKQHNMAKVYSGLYEVQGHIVPFMVIVKVGKPSEVQKPGNRGKRDSQMILMRFLNRVHYNLAMTPMELEMHHQIRNIIGVNPTFYEFCFQIDADTVVAPDSATRMVSAFVDDTRLIGVCGETALTNAKASMVTMMQVYEYYISHNLTKAFESLFGSVTCLPGCFSMYRIRAAETGKPLFVSKEVVEAYSEIRVDTLHMKNLLHLGEDRYLTTLLLKFHSQFKTKYIFRAHAWTIAPDTMKIFLSQRRRWINSTVHNLIELIPLQQLCGFCCFSMRFIVFVDLLSTIVQPVIVGYLAYLVYIMLKTPGVIPTTTFILLGAIYGLQAIIFILRRKWEMIGWMVIYILATPMFACALPLYSFWYMDDFSWGNTRVVTGEKGQKVIISDEGKFDPASIPKKKWEEYQEELWDAQTEHGENRSMVSGISYATKSWHMTGSGPQSEYNMQPSQPMSHLDAPPRYGSRMSMAPSQHMSEMEMSELPMAAQGEGPGQDVLLAEIRDILSKADLMTITKKGVKQELERRFGVNLWAQRAYIGSATESILNGTL